MIKEVEIQKLADRIAQLYHPEKIFLFGSFAWGTPTKDSDVDLLVVKRTKKKRMERATELREKLSGNDLLAMDIMVYTPAELEKSINDNKNLFMEDIVRNGRVLYTNPRQVSMVKLPKRPLHILH